MASLAARPAAAQQASATDAAAESRFLSRYLLAARHRTGGIPVAVTAKRVVGVRAADGGGGRLYLIAMMHVQRHQRFFDRRQRRPELDGVVSEAIERVSTNLHHPVELGGRVIAVGPQVHAGLRRQGFVGHVNDVALPGLIEDGAELLCLIGSRREILVGVRRRGPQEALSRQCLSRSRW